MEPLQQRGEKNGAGLNFFDSQVAGCIITAVKDDQSSHRWPAKGCTPERGKTMIINQTGVSSTFAFSGTGDEYVVAGVVTNLGTLASAVISSGQAGNTVTNAGQIASFGAGSAIRMTGGGTVANAGLISGAIHATGTLAYANAGRQVGFVAVTQDGLSAGSVISNRGTMVFADMAGNVAHVANAVIGLGEGSDTVVNKGRIVGDIQLGNGTNVFDGRGGVLLGTVQGGTGNDTYYLNTVTALVDAGGTDTVVARYTATLANGFENLTLGGFGNFQATGNTAANVLTGNTSANVLDGLGGNDTLLGGAGGDTLLGGTNNDSLDGQSGNDLVDGGFGNDFVAGGDGTDTVLGGTGSDGMNGGKAGDVLDGGIGADTMDGGDGDDRVTGGAFGTDVMTGGLGADVFVYVSANDSFATAAADIITDFERGVDKIDLDALAAAPFLFMGSGPFAGGAASVRITGLGPNTLVAIDLDGNSTADMQIVLTGAIALTGADFVL